MKTQHKIATAFFTLFISAGAFAQTLQDAIRLTNNEQYEKARGVLKKLIVSEPTNGDNFYYFGDLQLKMENNDSAKILFQKGLDINPMNPLTHVGMGRYLMYTGKTAEGQKELAYAKSLIETQANKKDMNMGPDRQVQIYLEMAETYTYAIQPSYSDAINYTNVAEKLNPKNPETFLIRGDALYKQDPVNGTPAITSYLQAAKLDPKSCRANVRIGQLYANGKNMPSAIIYYNNALKTDPSFAPAWRLKGEAFYQTGQYDSAQACYRNYLNLNDDPSARYRYCAFLYKNGNYEEAIVQGNQTLAKDSSITVIYRIIARCYLEMKPADPAKAIEYFNKFFAKQQISHNPPIIPDDYVNRAKAYSKMNQDSLAILDYDKAIAVDTTRKDIYFDMATSYYKMKRYDMAGKYYKLKIDNNPAAATLSDWVAYGRALLVQKDYAGADTAFKKGVALEPKNPAGWLYRAKANNFLDPDFKSDSTRMFYETYYDLAVVDKDKNKKDLITAAKYLAGYYFIKKNFACSKAWFNVVLELDPANADVKKQLDTDKDLKAATAADLNTCRLKPATN